MRPAQQMIARDHCVGEFIKKEFRVADQPNAEVDFVILGGVMPKHVHVWYQRGYGFFCVDSKCGANLPSVDAIRRINAAEKLNGTEAERQATEHDCMDDKFRASLFAYASELKKQ